MTITPSPKRSASRFKTALPATLHCDEGEFDCHADSLSRTGALLIGTLPWPSNSEVRVSLGDRSAREEIAARVVHVFEDEAATRIGIEFVELTDSARQTVDGLVSRAVEGRMPAALSELSRGAAPGAVAAALERIPVAHRVALAMRAMPKERLFLMQDPLPQVLEALARNPNITQNEIKTLARKHQLLPATIEAIAKDRRWAKDAELKTLLATHPRINLKVAEKLVESMNEMGQRKVLQTPGLSPALRTQLTRKFGNRRNKSW